MMLAITAAVFFLPITLANRPYGAARPRPCSEGFLPGIDTVSYTLPYNYDEVLEV